MAGGSAAMSARTQASRIAYSPSPSQHVIPQLAPGGASWLPPKTATAMFRAPSYEAPGSRGPSPSPSAGLGRYTQGLGSPPVSHRSGVHMEPIAVQVSHTPSSSRPTSGPPSVSRFSSRSPPPQRLDGVTISTAPWVSRSTSVPSTQSLHSTPRSHIQPHQGQRRPSTASCPSVHNSTPSTTTTVPAMPAMRAHSASVLPVSVEVLPSMAACGTAPAIASMPTLNNTISQAPPWAQVLPPQTARPIQTEELEQRLQIMETTVQLQQKDVQEARDMKDELVAQLEQKELRLREAEQRLLHEVEQHERTQRELIRARHDYDCAVVTNERLEMEHRNMMIATSTKTQHDRDEAGVEQWTQRCQQMTQRCEQMTQRCAELERIEQELQEKVQHAHHLKSTVEAQADERHRELTNLLAIASEASRRLDGEKRMLEVELEKVKDQQREVEHETRELRCRTAVLEDQLRDAQEQRQRTENDQQRAEQDLRQWYQKFIESNKENTVLQRANQDHKRDIWDLENQLRQERNAANVAKPGEYLKLMKAHEGESLATDNGRLKKALNKTQCDLDLCIRKLHEQERLIKELQEGCYSKAKVPGA